MIVLLAAVVFAQSGVVTGAVLDGAIGTPVASALVASSAATTRTNNAGIFSLSAMIGDTLRVRRIGYREQRVVVDSRPLTIVLTPVAATLGAVRVSDSAAVGRASAARDVGEMRERGITSVPDAVASMPFVTARGAHGESTLSLRGARPEQVVVLIDGMPLNDPASGRADLSDIPLAALGALAVTPGSNASEFGSGASGGVVALGSGDGSLAAVSGTSLGGIGVEGAHAHAADWGSARLGASLATTRNEYLFLNDAGARDTVETRHNADERRASLFGSAVVGRVQLLALYAVREQGLAGPKNVRAYDHARESSDRRLARVRVGSNRWIASAGARRLVVRYRDESHSELAQDASTVVVDADALLSVGGIALKAGGAREHVWGTGLGVADRPSAFASASTRRRAGRVIADGSVRFDAAKGAHGQLSPSLAVERSGVLAPFARVAQGFRLPTFYDLYAPTPLGFVATGVEPERVLLDAEAGLRMNHNGASVSASAFTRRTQDAIVWFPGNFSWSPTNVAREDVRGVEARAGMVGQRYSADLWASHYDTRLFTDGTSVTTPYVPRFSGGASARASLGEFSVSTRLSAIGRRPFAMASASRAIEMPGVFLADLHASWRFATRRGSALLTAGAINVGNTVHESIRRYPSPGRSWQLAITVQP